jgi:hypothetical protein
MRATLLLLSILALASAASAQTPSNGAVTRAPDGSIEVTGVSCSSLMVGADYVPGVAADGSAVAPADLPSNPSPITAEDATIRIDSSLAGKFGIPATGGPYDGKAIYGYVTVKDGKVLFNGKPLASDASAALADACHGSKK